MRLPYFEEFRDALMRARSKDITAQEFAKRCGVSDYAIRKACKQGRIQAKKFGHIWIIREKEVNRYMKNRPYQRGRKSNVQKNV